MRLTRLRPLTAFNVLLLALGLFGLPTRASALELLCDSAVTNCRTQLLNMINAETEEIDVGMWFMEDARFSNSIVSRFNAGVKVRILMDPRANVGHPVNEQIMLQLKNAGIPMRKRIASGIEHWKAMIFAKQGSVYFGSANFSSDAFVPVTPYVNYVDETVYYTDDPSVVNSFKTKFDDAWVDNTSYATYGNVTDQSRHFPTYAIDPELNFPPGQDFSNRSVGRYNNEMQKIDVIMYRITDQRHTNAMINARARGVPIRMIVDPTEYRNTARQWDSWNVDRLYMAGIDMRITIHDGINHGKLTLLYGQGMTIFGSSNWTSASANSQHEHNYFTTKTNIFSWFVNYFERRWDNSAPNGVAETAPFVPLPPEKPVNISIANAATGVPTTSQKLVWHGGWFAHIYDVYFGTSPDPPLFAANLELGPSQSTTQHQQFTLPTLAAGTTYYWKIVSKTMALQEKVGSTWSFTTAGTAPPPPAGATTVVLWTAGIPSGNVHGNWTRIADATAAGGAALQNPDAGKTKIAPALASPANYFEATFSALGNVPYHVWIRMRAQNNSLSNDSVHAQFNDSVDSLRTATMRIGTASSAEFVLQDGPSGSPDHGWGWTENGWGSLGPNIYFAADGTHTIRIQQREDGAIIDQIVISPYDYLSSPPGARQDDATILTGAGGGGEPPPPPPPPPPSDTIVLWTANAAAAAIHGNWQSLSDATAAGGKGLWNPDAGAIKIAPALAAPPNHFEMTFNADAGRPYHVWVRMRAQNNSLANDSVHLQYDDSVNATGGAIARIGTTTSTEYVLQDGPSGAPDHGWGWTENGWGSLGPHIYFATTGAHTIRVQQREDGPVIDQIVISPDTYLTASPGSRLDDGTILPASQ